MGEWMYKTTYFFTLAIVGGKWSASRADRLTPGERAPVTHWIGGWVGFGTGLDDVQSRKILPLPRLKLRPLGRPARSKRDAVLFRFLMTNVRKCLELIWKLLEKF
jgi:hypothetical protein